MKLVLLFAVTCLSSLVSSEITYHWQREGKSDHKEWPLDVTTDDDDVMSDVDIKALFDDSYINENDYRYKHSEKRQTYDGKCGVPNDAEERIIGGQFSKPGQWPWLVPVLVKVMMLKPNTTNVLVPGVRLCGASIIANKWLISAAHCFLNMKKCKPDGRVGVTFPGHARLNFHNSHSTIHIAEVYLPPNYNCRNDQHDIALVHLRNKIVFNKYESPICLPTPWEEFAPGTECNVAGWGKVGIHKPPSSVLKYTRLTIRDRSVCQQIYGSIGVEMDLKAIVCAGGESKDSCQGDSGGPLFCKKGGRWVQAGVVSFGPKKCGTKGIPAVYTAVSPFVEWIKRTMGLADVMDEIKEWSGKIDKS